MASAELDELIVADADALRAWLSANHATSPGVWLALTKKGGTFTTLTWQQAVNEALCFGWIDGQARKRDQETSWIRFTPRRPAVPGHNATSPTWPGWKRRGECCPRAAPR
jgi:uncharacterized protein YdeI (YjbR/CyaY-like superfamily)